MGSGFARRGHLSPAVPLLALLLAAAPLLLAERPTQAATTFVVTTAGDNPDADLADDRCDTTPATTTAPCSLRAAIHFNIPGGGLKTIRPATELPVIERKVTIDGYTQPGASPNTAAVGTNAVLRIELDGSEVVSGGNGLRIDGPNTLVRGLVINGFFDDGIEIRSAATGGRIAGCFVGTDATGAAARGNGWGVFVSEAPGTQAGGSGPAARNLISGNLRVGVLLGSGADGARVLGTLIGTTRTGAAPLGNGGEGVQIFEAANGTIGGATAGQANVIAFNGAEGILVFGSSAIGNRILRNSIFANGELGIDLGNDGATPNDAQDADDGPNTRQNVPVIEDAASSRVTGLLQSTPNQDFVLRLFSNPGSGDEGKVFEDGPLVVTTNADGNATFIFFPFFPDPPIAAGRTVTATATNQGGSTSEFSAAVPVEP